MRSAEVASLPVSEPFNAARLEAVFNDCFFRKWNTRLFGGAEEPLYQPAGSAGDCHALYYRADYFASALHEVAHWCIAGAARRQQLDFGYWYAPEGRAADEQSAFEAAECKPQALEWFFSQACAFHFQVSVDNIDLSNNGALDSAAFRLRVMQQARTWQGAGLPERADIFYRALCREFGTATPVSALRTT